MASPSPRLLDHLRDLIGPAQVLTGADAARYAQDWTGQYRWTPAAVLRPGSTAEVAAVMAAAHAEGAAVVPVSGNTGLNGGTAADGLLMLSLERLNRIRGIDPAARVATVEAGVILSTIHDAVADHGLVFPLFFGARGSALLGGALSTNAGGSNVLRYGNARALCLGLEVVLADGRVLDLMSALHKDNTGYDLRDLFIGAEGTLGIITAAVIRLHPAPAAQATALFTPRDVATALAILNRLQAASGGAVEAYEFMPDDFTRRLGQVRPDLASPLGVVPVTILAELATTGPGDAQALLEQVLSEAIEAGEVDDALVAQNARERAAFWARRETAAELCLDFEPMVDTDIALPLGRFVAGLAAITQAVAALDPGAERVIVAHLGDGNIHYTVRAGRDDPAHLAAIRAAIEATAIAHGGTFSAEHGIGLSKRASMAQYKSPVAVEVMQAIKTALDPTGILNPGKTIPAAYARGSG